MSTLYPNQGREQPIQPDELVCRDEWMELTGPAPAKCARCNCVEPVEGADQCEPCLKAIADEESAEATRALVERFNAAVAA
jgi:hypothetical protein